MFEDLDYLRLVNDENERNRVIDYVYNFLPRIRERIESYEVAENFVNLDSTFYVINNYYFFKKKQFIHRGTIVVAEKEKIIDYIIFSLINQEHREVIFCPVDFSNYIFQIEDDIFTKRML